MRLRLRRQRCRQPRCGCGGDRAYDPSAGLPALSYRVGTYATFRERMLERLSSVASTSLERRAGGQRSPSRSAEGAHDAPGERSVDRAARRLGHPRRRAHLLSGADRQRGLSDHRDRAPVGRRSSRSLIGYRPRPGVSASVFLAFTVSDGFKGEIPVGTRAQSVPGTGETAQYFETSVALPARDVWNDLQPRLTRPQVISPPPDPALSESTITSAPTPTSLTACTSQGDRHEPQSRRRAAARAERDDPDQQFLRVVERVDPQADDNGHGSPCARRR